MKKYIIDTICIAFIVLFIYAATSKLIDFQKFLIDLGKSPILTANAKLISIIIPTLEILISILLSFHRFRLFGLFAAFSLMTMFSTYIFIILNFSDYIPCSCGGVLQNMTWTQHIIFNLVFIALATIGILMYYPEIDQNKLE